MKHPHADMIIEWANDTSKVVQISSGISGWVDMPNPGWCPTNEYRFKPREFNDGEWHPCIDDNGEWSIYIYKERDGKFYLDGHIDTGNLFIFREVADMQWIGESLGKLKFGD